MSDTTLPPFRFAYEQKTEDLYAVAYVIGEYAGASNLGEQPCFSVIYASPKDVRQPFCLMSVDAQGHIYNYTNPPVSTVDQILMWAWDANGVHPAEWMLYCEQVGKATKQDVDPSVWDAYWTIVRNAAATVELFYVRQSARKAGEAVAAKYGKMPKTTAPLFRFRSGRSTDINVPDLPSGQGTLEPELIGD